jgi:uncharacterized protein YlxP (DUF503 family)
MTISSQVANKSTLNLVLGVFLKLLGFFVVLYTYTDINPIKAKQAEESIRERFNISISLLQENDTKNDIEASLLMQEAGRSFNEISEALKTEVDFLSSHYLAADNTLILKIPAEVAVKLPNKIQKSPKFANLLTDTLAVHKNKKFNYDVQIIINGAEEQILMQAVSLFVQKMASLNYPENLLTIGYEFSTDEPTIEFRIQAVTR